MLKFRLVQRITLKFCRTNPCWFVFSCIKPSNTHWVENIEQQSLMITGYIAVPLVEVSSDELHWVPQ